MEFTGEGVAALSMDQRMTIANMTTEWGALTGIFPFDVVLEDYLPGAREGRSRRAGDEQPAAHGRPDRSTWLKVDKDNL